MMWDWHTGWGGMGLGPFLWIGLLVVLVIVIVAIVRRSDGGTGAAAGGGKTAREILDERFARGEIDQAEYESRRKSLEN